MYNRAVPISLFSDYTDTACSRLLKQPVSRYRLCGRLWHRLWDPPIMNRYFYRKSLKNYYLSLQNS